LAERRPSIALRAALRLVGNYRVLVDRDTGPTYPWPRRAAVELVWGIAVRGLRTKLWFSLGRRVAAARWRLTRWSNRGAAAADASGATRTRR
jgi:hypothetical protein